MRVKLNDLTKYSKGSQINGDELIDDGKYIYLNGGINPSGKWNSYNVEANTVTISEGRNSSGYVNFISEPFWCGAHCYYLYDGPKNTRYLYYALKSQQERLFAIRSGACMPNIKKADLGKFEIEFETDLKMQDEIVSVLSKAESIINARQNELSKFDELIKARFVEMFGTVDNNSFGFKTSSLSDIATEFFAGGDKPEDCSPMMDKEHPYAVFANGYEKEGLQGYSQKCRVNKPAITVSARGTIGYCFIRTPGFTPIVRLITIVPSEEVSVEYLKYAIDTMQIKSSGTSQAQLTVPDFKRERIVVPPLELQKEFSIFVAQVDKSKLLEDVA